MVEPAHDGMQQQFSKVVHILAQQRRQRDVHSQGLGRSGVGVGWGWGASVGSIGRVHGRKRDWPCSMLRCVSSNRSPL